MFSTVLFSKTKALYQSQIIRQASVLFMGQAGAQFLALISYPILARLYTPAQFGEFAFINSLLPILLVAASGRYETAIILSHNSQHAKRLFQLAQWVLIGYTVALYVILLLPPVREQLQARQLNPLFFWVLPILVFFGGYWQIVQNWLTRFENYLRLSVTLFIQRLVIFLASLAFFFFSKEVNGLVAGLICGMVVVFALSFCFQRQPLSAPIKKLRHLAHSYSDFPLYSAPTLLVNIFTLHLPVLWFTFFYSQQEAGIYSLAIALILLPVTGLRTSFGHIFFQRVAREKAPERYKMLIRYCIKHAWFLLPISVVLAFFGEFVIHVFLGDEWKATGRIVSLLAPTILAQGLAGLLFVYLNTNRLQQHTLILNLLKLLLWLLALGIGMMANDFYLIFKLMAVFSYVQLLLLFLMARNFHKNVILV